VIVKFYSQDTEALGLDNVDNPFNIRASRTATCVGNVDNIEHDNAEICKLVISPHHQYSSLFLSSFQTATPRHRKKRKSRLEDFCFDRIFLFKLAKTTDSRLETKDSPSRTRFPFANESAAIADPLFCDNREGRTATKTERARKREREREGRQATMI
jgi:hypothetical protein